jgi:hypothetical protein
MFFARFTLAGGAILVSAGAAFAQNAPAHPPFGSGVMQETADQHRGMMPMTGQPGPSAGSIAPTLPGQDAFEAIQEIVRILEANPKTDWSKVDLEALRQHLIDMNEVTLKSDEAAKPIAGGIKSGGHRHRTHDPGDKADGPRADGNDRHNSPKRLERQDRAVTERGDFHGHGDGSKAGRDHPRSRLYRRHGQRQLSSDAPPRDSEG